MLKIGGRITYQKFLDLKKKKKKKKKKKLVRHVPPVREESPSCREEGSVSPITMVQQGKGTGENHFSAGAVKITVLQVRCL